MASKEKSIHEHILDIKVQDNATDQTSTVLGNLRAQIKKFMEGFAESTATKGTPFKHTAKQLVSSALTPVSLQDISGDAIKVMKTLVAQTPTGVASVEKKDEQGGSDTFLAKALATPVKIVGDVLGRMSDGLKSMTVSILSLPGKFITSVVGKLANVFMSVTKTLLALPGKLVRGIVEGLTTMITKVFVIFKKFSKTIVKTVLWPFNLLVNSIKDEFFLLFTLFREALGPVHDVLLNALMPLFIPLQHFLIRIVSALQPLVLKLVPSLTKLFLRLGDMILPHIVKSGEKVASWMQGWIQWMSTDGVSLLAKGWALAKKGFEAIWEWIAPHIPKITQLFTQTIWPALLSTFDMLKENIPKVAAYFVDVLWPAIKEGWDWFTVKGLAMFKNFVDWVKVDGIAWVLHIEHALSDLWVRVKSATKVLWDFRVAITSIYLAIVGVKLLGLLSGFAKGITAVASALLGAAGLTGKAATAATLIKRGGTLPSVQAIPKYAPVNGAAVGKVGMGVLGKAGAITGAFAGGYAIGTVLNKWLKLDKKISSALHSRFDKEFDPNEGLTVEALTVLENKKSPPAESKKQVSAKDLLGADTVTRKDLKQLTDAASTGVWKLNLAFEDIVGLLSTLVDNTKTNNIDSRLNEGMS